MGKFVFLFPYQFFKYELDFTNFILVYTNSLFFPRQYFIAFTKQKKQKKSPLDRTEILAKRRFIVFETSSHLLKEKENFIFSSLAFLGSSKCSKG
jgi:hypothetical protein